MALSNRDREKRYAVIHMMEDIFHKDEEPDNTPVVYEAADSRMKDLDEIQKFLDGKTLPYLGETKLDKLDTDLEISIFFMSNKYVQVDAGNNLLRLGISLYENECYVRPHYSRSCSLESFIGLPKKVDSPDFKNVSEITKLCNAPEIYNVYRQKALDIIRMRMPSAYSMFTGGSISHYQVSKGDAWWNKYNVRTLAVTFDKRFNKFLYLYHPEFILECAFDEWFLNRRYYNSLRDCYCYVLSFMITHEMMHLIHHNTTSTIDMGDVGGHRIVNMIQDSFINCQISRVFRGVSGISSGGIAPMPRVGIDSSITVRAEHNNGFKKYNNLGDLSLEIVKVISQITKYPGYEKNLNVGSSVSLDKLAGADVFITIDVSPTASSLRGNSALFQKLVNELIKTITEGRVYDKFSKLSDAEKETDKSILTNGTLVQVKGTSIICSVNGYDESSKEYDLIATEISEVTKEEIEPGVIKCTPVYTPTKPFGTRRRMDIRPFNPEDNSWVEADGDREKKTSLSDDDLKILEQDPKQSPANIVDAIVDKMGKEVAVGLIDSIIVMHDLENYKDPADVLVDAVHGMSEEDCANHLGEIIYNSLKDAISTMEKMGLVPQLPQTPTEKSVPVYHIGDVVWVRRKRKFGRITSIDNGMFALEEMEEVGVRVLDDSSKKGISEGVVNEDAPKIVLKERVFKPTGKQLGIFPAFDLETFDMEYKESDMKQSQQDGQQGNVETSTVPPPKDDNPLKPENDEDGNNSGSGESGGQSGQSNGGPEDESEPDIPDEWDVNGQDLDDEEPYYSDDMETSYGDSDDASGSMSSGEADSSDEPGDEFDGSDSSDGSGSDDNGDEDNLDYGDNGSGDSDDSNDSGDSSDGGSDSGDSGDGSTGNDDSGDSSDESDNTSDGSSDNGSDNDSGSDDSSRSSEKSNDSPQMGSGGSGSSGGGTDSGDADYDDVDWDPGEEESWSMSDIEKALDKIDSEELESSKQRRTNEEEREDKEIESRNDPNDSQVDPAQVRAAKDMLGKAIKDARDQTEKNTKDRDRRVDIDETDILGSMGAGSLTSSFVPKMLNDWKAKLEKIIDQALGFDIVTNPNLVNKKLEDAPPGREDEIPEIKSIAVLLDCSGSMGADKFVQVIKHLDTMFMVRKMDKTVFHIIDWGTDYVQSVAKTYVKVKGRVFKKEIMTHKDHGWGTSIIPALVVSSQKIHKPDAILILTDAEIFDGNKMGRTPEGKIAADYVKKYRKKIIWVLTADGKVNKVKEFDPTAKQMDRIIRFKKG